jgi:hypothetical protein
VVRRLPGHLLCSCIHCWWLKARCLLKLNLVYDEDHTVTFFFGCCISLSLSLSTPTTRWKIWCVCVSVCMCAAFVKVGHQLNLLKTKTVPGP